jgi:hypothetical protein
MMAARVPVPELAPRRARQLLPADLPRRAELIAASAVAVVLAHLLLAQLTLILTVGFAAASRVTRWRLSWLLVPAGVGVAWILLAGLEPVLAGFTAGPASVLRHLGLGAAPHSARPLAAFAGINGWLPRQLPAALPLAAAEAAVIGWLGWLHTDEWALPPPRPGVLAALRTAAAARRIQAGAVLTRDGCTLGVVPDSGATVGLSWAEVSRGVLLTGSDERTLLRAGQQVMHAALRRRKPVFVLDDDPGGPVGVAVAAACEATGTPLLAGADRAWLSDPTGAGSGGDSASWLWRRGPADPAAPVPVAPEPAGLRRVIAERSAVLLSASSPELAALACAGLTALAADLRRIGVDGDALVWVPRAERIPPLAVAALLRAGAAAGLGVLTATTISGPAADLAGVTGVTLIGRVADPGLAARLAPLTGTRLGPPAVVPPAGRGPILPGDQPLPGSGLPAADLVPGPAVPVRELLTLGPAQFVLAVSTPRRRLARRVRLVPARLRAGTPRGAPSASRAYQ